MPSPSSSEPEEEDALRSNDSTIPRTRFPLLRRIEANLLGLASSCERECEWRYEFELNCSFSSESESDRSLAVPDGGGNTKGALADEGKVSARRFVAPLWRGVRIDLTVPSLKYPSSPSSWRSLFLRGLPS